MHVICTFIRKNDSSTLVDVLYSTWSILSRILFWILIQWILIVFELCIPIALKNWVERGGGGGGTQTKKIAFKKADILKTLRYPSTGTLPGTLPSPLCNPPSFFLAIQCFYIMKKIFSILLQIQNTKDE